MGPLKSQERASHSLEQYGEIRAIDQLYTPLFIRLKLYYGAVKYSIEGWPWLGTIWCDQEDESTPYPFIYETKAILYGH